MKRALTIFLCLFGFLSVQAGEIGPAEAQQLLDALKAIRELKSQQLKARKSELLQKALSAAASGQAAAAAWEDAVRMVQFDGSSREGSQFKEWKEKEGAGLREKEGQTAARLYFRWLALTLQRSSGVPVKDLLPSIIEHAKEVMAEQATAATQQERVEHLSDKKDKSIGTRKTAIVEKIKEDQSVKRIREILLNRGLAGSPPVRAYQAEELIAAKNWENAPGNVQGIYEKIILPEMRASADPRLLEYWDMKIRQEAQNVTDQKLTFQADKFNQVRRPELLWSRAKDDLLLGNRSRALSSMFGLIKNYPSHPAVEGWIGELQQLLTEALAPSAVNQPAR